MDAIRIRHCRLRIQRHGGWSWGPEPERLVQLATRALPQLLAQKLQALLPDTGADRHIKSLQLRIPISLPALTALEAKATDAAVAAKIQQALAQHPALGLPATDTAILAGKQAKQTTNPDPSAQLYTAPLAAPSNTLQLLLQWYKDASLLSRLQSFSAATARLWQQQILLLLAARGQPSPPDAATLAEFIHALDSKLHQRLPPAQARLFLLAALADQFPGALPRDHIARLLSQYSPQARSGPLPQTTASAAAPASPDTADLNLPHSAPEAALPTPSKRAKPARHTEGMASFELQVDSVLPFIAAGLLARQGYFDVLAASLDAGATLAEMDCFAQGLALKLLAPAQRGWYHTDRQLSNAAALAGLTAPIGGAALQAFARHSQDSFSAADAHLYQLLKQGHDPAQALLIHYRPRAQAPAWTLSDTQGNFLLGWFDDSDALLAKAKEFPGNSLLLSSQAGSPPLIAALGEAGLRFITPLPPGRDEHWRQVDAGNGLSRSPLSGNPLSRTSLSRNPLWSNDRDAPAAWLAQQARQMDHAVRACEAISAALLEQRPILPQQSGHRRFEYSLNLAAAAALASIAWELWGKQESTDALQALQRLGDLSGKVVCDKQRLRVYPALGRRYQDLQQHGLLQNSPALPWLQGRGLEFAGL